MTAAVDLARALKNRGVHDERCPRCGASTFGTHHPLCEDKCGNQTDLPDWFVRAKVAEIRRAALRLVCLREASR